MQLRQKNTFSLIFHFDSKYGIHEIEADIFREL